MSYKVERQKGKVVIDFKVGAGEWESALAGAYLRNKDKYALGGFRKGKVPRKIIENMYGPSVFYEDAFNALFNKAYGEVLEKETDIYPVASPDVDVGKLGDEGVEFVATVVVKPEVKLGKYKGIECKRVSAAVADKEIDEEIERARERAARKTAVDKRTVKNGDFCTVDYSGSVDGVKFDGGSADGQELEIGGGSFIPGFEEQLIGMTTGGEKDIEVTFPSDYHAAHLAGKRAVFHIKLHEIRQKELPALDDEFAKDLGFDTLTAYRADAEKRLSEAAQKRADAEMENALIDKIAANADVDIPRAMVETQLNHMLRDIEYRLMYQGLKLDDYFARTNTTAEGFKKEREKEAENIVKTRLTVEAIVKAEKLTVSDAEVDEKLKEEAERYKTPFEEYKKDCDARRLDYIKNDLLGEKFIKFLKGHNTFK